MSELPEGWTTAGLTEVCELNPGKPKADSLTAETEVSFVPMAAVDANLGAIAAPVVRSYASVSKGFTAFQNGDVIVAKITPCMENGKAAVARNLVNDLGFGSTEFHVFRPSGAALSEYVFYFIRQESFRKSAEANMTGSVGQKRVPASFLNEVNLPLPPFNEQRRIVAKLEKLLSRVDAAQARLATIPRILKRFRQSVLAAACSGELTADWRAQNQVTEEYESVTVEDVTEYVGGFAYKSPTFLESGTSQVVRIGNVRPFALNLNASPVFIPDEIARATERFELVPDDILISMTGTKYKRDYGCAAIVTGSNPKLFLNQRVSRLRCGDKVLPLFMLYWLQTDIFRGFFFEGETGNVNQGNVGADGIRKAPIELPSLPEQQEIVRRVEALFKTADALEARYRTAKAHVDKLTQAILARAFRGELVTTEAKLARLEGRTYEAASVLLERIRQERARQAAPKRKTSAKSKATKQARAAKLFYLSISTLIKD